MLVGLLQTDRWQSASRQAPPVTRVLLETLARQQQKLWRGLEIYLCAKQVLMPQIGRQPWQLRVHICAFKGPGGQPMNGKRMA